MPAGSDADPRTGDVTAPVPDFSEDEVALIRARVTRRWNEREVRLVLADVEVLPHGPESAPLTCPAVFWRVGECSFVVQKLGEGRFRSRFFYPDLIQYGTGIAEHADPGECTTTLLQVQADHQRGREGASSGAAGEGGG